MSIKALILAGSDVLVTDALKELCKDANFVVAADSGVRHAAELGVTPDLIVGDFDSAAQADLDLYPDVPRQTYPVRKDSLDLELALDEAVARGATELLIVGALGGRLDQTLAALLIASRYQEKCRVTLHSGDSAAYPLRTGDVLTLDVPAGLTFSVFSLSQVSKVSLVGLSYPLTHAELPFGVGLGVSNETTAAPLTVSLHEGSALLLLSLS